MESLRKFRLGPRLGMAFGILCVLIVCMGALGLAQLGRLNGAVDKLGNEALPGVQALGEFRSVTTEVRGISLRYMLETDPQARTTLNQKRDAALGTKYAKAKTTYEQLPLSPQERQAFEQIVAAWTTYLASESAMMKAADGDTSQREESLRMATGVVAKQFSTLMGLMDTAIAANAQQADQSRADANQTYSSGRNVMLTLVVVAVACALLLAWAITRSITLPMAQSLRVAQTVAKGDLTAHIDATGNDEAGDLLRALREMNDRLLATVSQVREGSESVATGASQIASGNTDLSQRTEEQAANLEETAASMEELTATVKTSGDTARQASQLAGSACTAATQGGEVVSQVVSTMNEISASSRKIGDIIGVIDGIAFQTNILALNAAVEAARAGEQGRGFAVVASEVRSLAQRSAEAAREIKTLIHASMERVEAGSQLVGTAGTQMGDIVVQVQRVADLINEISAAATEQVTGIGQVNDAVGQLDQVTQQNAALVEQSAAAADSLNQQAQRLLSLVDTFKTGDHHTSKHGSATEPTPTPSLSRSLASPMPAAHRVRSVVKPSPTTAATSPLAKSGKPQALHKDAGAAPSPLPERRSPPINAVPATDGGTTHAASAPPAPRAHSRSVTDKPATTTATHSRAMAAEDDGDWETF
jgi:methyl-accepting chemotaxis protein